MAWAASPSLSPSPQATSDALPQSTLAAVTVPKASDGNFLLTVNATGPDVVRMQQRLIDLGYYTYRATGAFGSLTYRSVIAFQLANNLLADGRVGESTYSLVFSGKAVRSKIQTPTTPTVPSGQTPGETMDWETVKALISTDVPLTVTDYYTNKQFTLTVADTTGGHAEVECATLSDYTVYESLFTVLGTKRPVLVNIDGKLVAASLSSLAHGNDTVAGNVMTGHVCLYFAGSALSALGIPDVEHQNNVNIAGGIV